MRRTRHDLWTGPGFYGTARAPRAREMVSAAVRTAGPARSGFIRADQPETDSAPGYLAAWAVHRAGHADQAGPGFLGVVGEAGLADPVELLAQQLR